MKLSDDYQMIWEWTNQKIERENRKLQVDLNSEMLWKWQKPEKSNQTKSGFQIHLCCKTEKSKLVKTKPKTLFRV